MRVQQLMTDSSCLSHHLHNHKEGNEVKEKESLIMEVAPPDQSTYIEGDLEKEMEEPKDRYGSFSFGQRSDLIE